jgi:hypothetical protein
MNDHMVPFMKGGKKYVRDTETGKEYPVSDIQMPSWNELEDISKKNQSKRSEQERGGVEAMATRTKRKKKIQHLQNVGQITTRVFIGKKFITVKIGIPIQRLTQRISKKH